MADQPSLWDLPQEAEEEPPPPAEAAPAQPRATPRILRVTDLNRRVRTLLDGDSVLADVWVEGEVSQPSFPPSGHCFFTLKDANSQVRAALFREELDRAGMRPVARHERHHPRPRPRLRAAGRLPALRRLDHRRRCGRPACALRGAAQQLAAAGLFEDARKRPIPRWPRRIGVVTSPVGAVWRDINNVLRRRYPLVELILSPSVVQGVTAAPAIVRALQRLYAQRDLDTIILARGGGSLEDLWSFNDERVVRAVAEAPVPIIVGVGHESDVTLADFAADLRAPTPSAAAELATPDADADRDRDRPPARPGDGRAAGSRRGATNLPRRRAPRAGRPGTRHGRCPTAHVRPARSWRTGAGRPRWLAAGCSWNRRTRRCARSRRRPPSSAAMPSRAPPMAGSCATRPRWRRGEPLQVTVARGTVDTRVERTRADGTEELLS